MRFAVLRHDPQEESSARLHWDFLLEQTESLRTWSLEQQPDQPGPIRATSLPDHRKVYLTYEGPVSGHRGRVTRWDAGTYSVLNENECCVELQLVGKVLCGTARLTRTAAHEVDWRFQFEFASPAS